MSSYPVQTLYSVYLASGPHTWPDFVVVILLKQIFVSLTVLWVFVKHRSLLIDLIDLNYTIIHDE